MHRNLPCAIGDTLLAMESENHARIQQGTIVNTTLEPFITELGGVLGKLDLTRVVPTELHVIAR